MQKIKSSRELESFLNNEFGKLRNQGKVILPNSKYFKEVGSTTCEDIAYAGQLEVKQNALKSIFADVIPAEILDNLKVTASPEEFEYRLKMEFVCAYNPMHEPFSRFGQRKKGNFSWVIDMDECNLISKDWFNKTRKVYELLQNLGIRNYDLKKNDGELRYIVFKGFGENAMLTIITKTDLEKDKIQQTAAEALKLGFESIYWLKNNSVSDVATGEPLPLSLPTSPVDEAYSTLDSSPDQSGLEQPNVSVPISIPVSFTDALTAAKITYKFQITPFTFFQNNIYCFEEILKYINDYLSKNDYKDAMLFDLYCGVGTIGICFAKYFKNLIGLELVEDSIALAKANAALNNVQNATFEQIDLYKSFSEKYHDIAKKLAIVDPPRTGLEAKGVEGLLNLAPGEIIYISCNPITQALDLERLKSLYKIVQAQGFDMFPQTNHVENVVILKR